MGSRLNPWALLAAGALLPAGAGLGWDGAEAGKTMAKAATKSFQPPASEPQERRQAANLWSVSLQTGLADTFQLTLGGLFGEGPAWQSRVTIARSNVFREGDAVTLSGFNTHDLPSRVNDWTAALAYRTRVVNRRGHVVYASGGLERWRFPGVLTGSQDWNLGYNATYTGNLKRVPVTVQSNAWTILHSNYPGGSLVYTTAWFDHNLLDGDSFKLVLRHGPQHTYSWDFYGTDGHRVIRYASALVVSHGPTSVEFGYRQQYGLQKNIPHNRFWHLMLSRSF